MAKNNQKTISPETQDEAMTFAKKTNKPGQSKEQTRLIALGIQKGIAEYKKNAKSKQREADKASKKNKSKQSLTTEELQPEVVVKYRYTRLPWVLLLLSWAAVAVYFITTH
ncbi:MAG: hypothetical protein ACJAZP_000918 [Psychromonas sp.]|jgi:hypothetical protein|uniref:DUF2956 domain-containing protein n=1 Tax=Psychromonas sp. TaxID=1884585 RepID=UPI0039E64182